MLSSRVVAGVWERSSKADFGQLFFGRPRDNMRMKCNTLYQVGVIYDEIRM